MTSKEMEARSGVPRANIRYYESEGLLTPARAKNGYRDYSEADLALLEKIKLLRRLGIGVEELRELQRGSRNLTEALDSRMASLAGERGTLERVEQVCGELRRSGQTFETLDPGPCLSALDAPALPAAEGMVWWKAPPAPALPETDALPVYTGLSRRLLARLFDEWGMMFFLVGAIALTGHNPSLTSGLALDLAVQSIWLFLEPLLLRLFGTTPGKALLGLRITGRNGKKLTYSEGFTRHLLLLWHGEGFFIPIWSWIQMFRTARRCWNDEPQPWDVDTAYEAAPFRPLRHAGAMALASALILAGAEAANSYSQLPPQPGGSDGGGVYGELQPASRLYQPIPLLDSGRDGRVEEGSGPAGDLCGTPGRRRRLAHGPRFPLHPGERGGAGRHLGAVCGEHGRVDLPSRHYHYHGGHGPDLGPGGRPLLDLRPPGPGKQSRRGGLGRRLYPPPGRRRHHLGGGEPEFYHQRGHGLSGGRGGQFSLLALRHRPGGVTRGASGKKEALMICPYCQSEMQKGELTADGRRGITWWPSDGPSWNRVIVAKNALWQSQAEAFYCGTCKKILIDV